MSLDLTLGLSFQNSKPVFLLEITQTPESQPVKRISHMDEGSSHSFGQALLQSGDESSAVRRAGRTTSV